MKSFDVIVIGLGGMGSTAVYQLAQQCNWRDSGGSGNGRHNSALPQPVHASAVPFLSNLSNIQHSLVQSSDGESV